MFEKFTERARTITILATSAALDDNALSIGAHHLLLGILREEEGLAARVLDNLDVVEEEVYRISVRLYPPFPERENEQNERTAQIPFAPVVKTILDLALREALSLGHNYIGTEHILLGLVSHDDNRGTQILKQLIDIEKIRPEIIRMLQGPGGKVSNPVTPPQVATTASTGSSTYYGSNVPPPYYGSNVPPPQVADLLALARKVANQHNIEINININVIPAKIETVKPPRI